MVVVSTLAATSFTPIHMNKQLLSPREPMQVLTEIGNMQADIVGLRWSRFHHAVYTGTLIPGCRYCMRRSFACMHVGQRCNLDCAFCPIAREQRQQEDATADAGVREADWQAALRQHRAGPLEAASITGGEPLLYMAQVERLCADLRALNEAIHIWLYTNGSLATRERFRSLERWGVGEVRINLAASDYADRGLAAVALARSVFAHVAVEVPVYPSQRMALMSALPKLEQIGIDQLNLQELVVTPANIDRLQGRPYAMGPVHLLDGSRRLTYRVIRHCLDAGYSYTCTDCSAGLKHQLDSSTPLGY